MSFTCHKGMSNALPRTRSQTLLIMASSSSAPVQQSILKLHGGSCGPSFVPLRRAESLKSEAASLTATIDAPAGQALQQQAEKLSSFEDMVQHSSTPILVDFYAPWCGPCQMMSKVVADVSNEMKDDLKVMKINTDSYPKLASKYRVQALPTCLLFRDGMVIDRVDGFMPEPTFAKRMRFYVARLDKKFGRR